MVAGLGKAFGKHYQVKTRAATSKIWGICAHFSLSYVFMECDGLPFNIHIDPLV